MQKQIKKSLPIAHLHTNTNFQFSFYPTSCTRENPFKIFSKSSQAKQFPFQSLLDNYQRVKCKTASNQVHSYKYNAVNISFLSKYLTNQAPTRNLVQSIDYAKISPIHGETFISEQPNSNTYHPTFANSPSKQHISRKYRAKSAIYGQAQRYFNPHKKSSLSRKKWLEQKSIEEEKHQLIQQLSEMNDRHTKIENVQKDETNERMKMIIVNIRNRIYEGSRLLKKIGTL